jgi:DNA repair exonuclease SbcCD ATPase subunit
MRAQARLLAIELEAFRGFAETQRLDLDADAVLVRGDNGTGKTSITDGLLWLFTGKIPRLTERARGLRKTDDPVVSRYRAGSSARVRVTLGMPEGRMLAFEREGRADRSELSAWDGENSLHNAPELLASAFGDFTAQQLTDAVGSWGILQQHALLAALDSGTALHARLAEVVGLERVTRFATSATEVAKALARERKSLEGVRDSLRRRHTNAYESLTAARAVAEDPVGAQRQLQTLVRDCVDGLSEGIAVPSPPEQLDEITSVGQEIGDMLVVTRDVLARRAELEAAQQEGMQAVDDAEGELASLLERANSAIRRAPAQVQLANAVLQLLGDECPVCGRPIDEASLRQHMTELLETAEAEAAAAIGAQQAVVDAQSRLEAARRAERRRIDAQEGLDYALVLLRKEAGALDRLEIDQAWLEADRVAELTGQLERFQDQLRAAYSEGGRTLGAQILRLSTEAETAATELDRVEGELADVGTRCERAAELDKAAHRAAERIVDRALRRLTPSFAEVFDRLSPHPSFTELRATQDIFYGKNQVVPEVYDPEHKVSGNPALVFSEGQLNVVALSYFIGLALNAGDGALPFLVLDDPLQAMDVLSVLGFADLCRRIREQRQLIVTTHDRRFAALLERKLAPREAGTRTILHEFESWTADGPRISSRDEPLADVAPLRERRAS